MARLVVLHGERPLRSAGTLAAAALLAGAALGAEVSPPATLGEALARAAVLRSDAQEISDRRAIFEECRVTLAPWIGAARLAYQHLEDSFPFQFALCSFADDGVHGPRIDADGLARWLAPWRQILDSRPERDPLLDAKWDWFQMSLTRWIGLPADADKRYFEVLSQRLDRLRVAPTDPQLLAEVAFAARMTFGSWEINDHVKAMHALFEQRVGATHPSTLIILRSLAYHARFLGRPGEALEDIERAVALAREHHPDDQALNAHMATEHAACLAAAGRIAESYQRMLDARPFFAGQLPTQHQNLARVDMNLAGTALEMGDYVAAIEHAESAIHHALSDGSQAFVSESLVPRSIREVARLRLGLPDAAARLREALAATNNEAHIGSEAAVLVRHAVQTGDRELMAWAMDFLDMHIRRFRTPMQSDTAWQPLMHAWRMAGPDLANEAVRPWLDRALAISLTGRSPGTAALAYFSLARHEAVRHPESAIWLYKHGANALQQLRGGLPQQSPELHRAWLDEHEPDLRRLIGLLIDQGRLGEAEQALRALRDEEIHEFTRRSAARRSTQIEALSFTPQEAVRNTGLDLAGEAALRAARAADARIDAHGIRGIRTLWVDPAAEQDLVAITEQVHRVVDDIPSARHFSVPAPTKPLLLPRRARLTAFVRGERIDLIVQHLREQRHRRIEVPETQLNRLVQSMRAALSSEGNDPLGDLQTLHRWLIAPVVADLKRWGVKRIEWVPDAALRYVPLAALHDGRRFLAQDYVVSTQLGGNAGVNSTRAPQARQPAATSIVGFGRTRGDAEHAALPAVADELRSVQRSGGSTWADDDFTATSLRQALLRRPTVVHLASHFVLDPASDDKSYLLLGDGKHMSLAELAALPWQGVQLALLSACDSGVPTAGASGRAWAGFAAALQSAGAANVVATLWRVEDRSTARWMDLFYRAARARARPGAAPRFDAQAATDAQRQWLKMHAGSGLMHPHHWSGMMWLARE